MARAYGIETSGLPMTRREALAAFPAVVAAGYRARRIDADGPASDCRGRHRIPQGVARAGDRRSLPGWLWMGRTALSAGRGYSLAVRRPEAQGRPERGARQRHPGMKIYPTIAEALTRGGEQLAVDGVLVIGEHGRYPRNEKGQYSLSSLRILQADRGRLPARRPVGAGLQR